MILSVCFNPKPVLYKQPIVWWLKIGMVQNFRMNAMAETIINTLNMIRVSGGRQSLYTSRP